MVALPFCHLTLKTGKPRNPAYPENIKTLGDHIRKRRLDLGLHQKDVAVIVNATTSTVTNWEKNRSNVAIQFIPKIILFLGYDPFFEAKATMAQQIKQYRRWEGLSIKKLAKMLRIDPATLRRWERGDSQLSTKRRNRLNGLFGAVIERGGF